MNIKLYKLANISRKINKSIPQTAVLDLDGTLKEDCNLLEPSVTIQSATVPDVNYAYIASFGRYYYVAPPVCINTNVWRLDMHVDVLKTYASGIMSAPCIVAKSADTFNMYLNDSNYKCYQDPYIFSERFPQGFDLSSSRFVVTLFGDYVQAT